VVVVGVVGVAPPVESGVVVVLGVVVCGAVVVDPELLDEGFELEELELLDDEGLLVVFDESGDVVVFF
jgi:hypothetical protein